MRYKYYYLITHGDKKYLILAGSSQEAIDIWIKEKNTERMEEGRKVMFNPSNFSIEEIIREDFVIKASE